MANIGRFGCVLGPFLLTLAALIAIMVSGLAGVTDNTHYMFELNTTDLSISSSSALNLVGLKIRSESDLEARSPLDVHLADLIPSALQEKASGTGGNLTAQDLGLYDDYRIGVWTYCYTARNHTQGCSAPKFNWAESFVNISEGRVDSLITSTGKNVTLPAGITDAIKAFVKVSRWAETVFILACIGLGVELFMGLFTQCSRAVSCITFAVALVATVIVCAYAALTTAMSVIIVGAVKASAVIYGVTADLNTHFLVAAWLGAAFSIGSTFFWMFTICCCCKPHHRDGGAQYSSRDKDDISEKLVPAGAYVPVAAHDGLMHRPEPYPGAYAQAQAQATPEPTYGYASGANGPMRDSTAYEPYSHARG